MNTNFELYKIFYYVCRNMSITVAAEELYVSQPAISKQIKNLEHILGVDLFIRDRKGIQLTVEGEKLYKKIKNTIETLLLVPEYLSEIPKEIKIIAGYSTIKKYLISSLSKYNELYPEINFELNTYRYHDSINKLRNLEADIIFIHKKNIPNNDLDGLECHSFLEIHDIFVVNRKYEKVIEENISLKALIKYPIICKSNRSVARSYIEEELKKINLKFFPKFQLSNNWLIEEYVKLNFGIGIVSREFVMDELNSGEFIEIKTDFVLPKREIIYVIRKDYVYKKLIDDIISDLKSNF